MTRDIFTTAELRKSGLSRKAIERLVADGAIRRIRRGWYARPTADRDVVEAIAVGGSLSCGAALRRHGIWVLHSHVHFRVPADIHPVRRPECRTHRIGGTSIDGVDDLATALRVAQRCMTRDELVCVIDSCLNLGRLTRRQLERVLDRGAGRAALARADAGAQSGVESLARMALASRGIAFRSQVKIAGVGRVDLLVGERLVIELDGDEWHSTPEQRAEDRRRDSALVALGYVVIHAGYQRIVNHRALFISEVLSVVHRGEHHWRAVHPVPKSR